MISSYRIRQRFAENVLPWQRRWQVLFWPLVAMILAPLFFLLLNAVSGDKTSFAYFYQPVFLRYLLNTIVLVTGVVLLSSLWGVSCAWLIACFRFPGWRFLRWALLLPLAVPSYISAYIYTDFFDYTGPVQRLLRNIFGWESAADYRVFSVRNLPGAIFILSLLFFPYIYLILRSSFARQNEDFFAASATMGYGGWRQFFYLGIPLAQPAWMAAAGLVMMETIADFGLAHYFGLQTLTQAIYDSWIYFNDLAMAARISLAILIFILLSLAAERLLRVNRSYQQQQSGSRRGHYLYGHKAFFACLWCSMPVFLGFAAPIFYLLLYSWRYRLDQDPVGPHLLASLSTAMPATAVILLLALLLGFYRRCTGKWGQWVIQLCGFGYALPGVVLAVAILLMLGAAQFFLNQLDWRFNLSGFLLGATLLPVIFALVVRFLRLALSHLEMTWQRIPVSFDQASASMGYGAFSSFCRIHLPLLTPTLLSAAVLVFIESVKELSAVLLLAPFNFFNLATYVYQYVSEEQLERAATAALLLLLIGILPAILLLKVWSYDEKYT